VFGALALILVLSYESFPCLCGRGVSYRRLGHRRRGDCWSEVRFFVSSPSSNVNVLETNDILVYIPVIIHHSPHTPPTESSMSDRPRAATPLPPTGEDDFFDHREPAVSDLEVIVNFDGLPVHNVRALEPEQGREYDCVPVDEHTRMATSEETALSMARKQLFVYRYNHHIYTSTCRVWPAECPDEISSSRPPLALDNIYQMRWLEDRKPHLAFIPRVRTFKGYLLDALYWIDNPAKMLERNDGITHTHKKMYRAKNSQALSNLFSRLLPAFRALKKHVYPPSMQSWLELDTVLDQFGRLKWHEGVPLAMHYGRRDVCRNLELVGAIMMMITLSRVQTGNFDAWQRILAVEPYYRRWPSDIDQIASSILASTDIDRVGCFIDATTSTPILRYHLKAMEISICPIYVRWTDRPLLIATKVLHPASSMNRFVCSDDGVVNAVVRRPSHPPPLTPVTFSTVRPEKTDSMTAYAYLRLRVANVQLAIEDASPDLRHSWENHISLVKTANSWHGGWVAPCMAYEWYNGIDGMQCRRVSGPAARELFHKYPDEWRWYDFVVNCWEIGPLFQYIDPRGTGDLRPLLRAHWDRHISDFIGGLQWWHDRAGFVVGHPQVIVRPDVMVGSDDGRVNQLLSEAYGSRMMPDLDADLFGLSLTDEEELNLPTGNDDDVNDVTQVFGKFYQDRLDQAQTLRDAAPKLPAYLRVMVGFDGKCICILLSVSLHFL
jgi:hypothetical protein